MNKQNNQWDEQPLPQGMAQEINEQELDTVTGGGPDRPIVLTNKPLTYLFEGSRPPRAVNASEMVTLSTLHPTHPGHQEVMSKKEPGTVWDHNLNYNLTTHQMEHVYTQIHPK